jgi:hypothetical protein
MRFSLKWILVGVAYFALAAAAVSQPWWVYADVLWAVSLLAMAYATLLTAFARGRRQVAAAGFVVAGVCFLGCLSWSSLMGGESVPMKRLLEAAGIGQRDMTPSPMYYAPPLAQGNVYPGPVSVMPEGTVDTFLDPAAPAPVATAAVAAPPVTVYQTYQPTPVTDPMAIRAGNAAGMILFGGAGFVLGLIAYNAARRDDVAAQ